MIDITATLQTTMEKDACSVLKALLTLLEATIEKEEEEKK